MKFMDQGRAVDPMALLNQRERRGELLEELSRAHPEATLVSFMLNIPGPVKNHPLLEKVFEKTLSDICDGLPDSRILWKVSLDTGPEAILKTFAPVEEVKQAMVALEEASPRGRLYDIDVHSSGRALSREALGLGPRLCLLCDRPARVCSRAGTHSLTELLKVVEELILKEP